MDYTQRVSAGIFDHASESIDKTEEEYGDINTTVPIPTNETEVESGETVQDLTDQGDHQSSVDETEKTATDRNPDAAYTRSVGFQVASGQIELDTPDNFEKADTTKERLAEIQMVNEELERQGNHRRYVASKTDAPETAQLYEDDFGKYYYKEVDVTVRPSDIADFAEEKAIVALNDDQKALKTIEFMSEVYSDPLVDANTKEAAETWLDRHLMLTDDDPGSEDTFSHEFKGRLAELIADA